MITYRFVLSERELEIVLMALSTPATDSGADGSEARALQRRLDTEADEQFLQHEYPQHAG